jgi:methylated-DNA-[protein]-cysteine S-methyltransferase
VISYSSIKHPLIGEMLLVADDQWLIRSSYTDSKLAPKADKNWIRNPVHPILEQAVSQLAEYLSAKRAQFTVPLLIQGTEFQRQVYNLILQTPVGSTTSYMELAAKLSKPRAARSVGAAISKNPLLIFIPDHRVLNRDRSIGGFAGTWNRKPGLLELEKRLAAQGGKI